jgi:hypothetical protein
MNSTLIQEILVRVQEIHKKHELLANINGDNFNVFSILGMENCENKTHSNFLRELLDPRGSHGLKSTFLKLFVSKVLDTLKHNNPQNKLLEIIDIEEKKWEQAHVATEKHIGGISSCGEYGGRIDIVISIGYSPVIIIENKIYAGDQEKQLLRYSNYAKKTKALLLYLTRGGDYASELSTSKLIEENIDYLPISYSANILSWLDDCSRESYRFPLIRETIIQYANLIRKITNQNTSNNMESVELSELILENEQKFEAAWIIYQEFKKMQDQRIHELKNLIGTLEVIWINIDEIKIKCGFGLDGGPYLCFSVWKNGVSLRREARELETYLGHLRELGYNQTNGNYWKHVRFWTDSSIEYKYFMHNRNIEELKNEIINDRNKDLNFICTKIGISGYSV